MQGRTELQFRSPAKINWILRVLGRREDGFHEIESLMSTVTLCDELIFSPRPDPGFSISSDCAEVPLDGRNLICRAAALLSQQAVEPDRLPGVHCRLIKRSPVGGGVGGGSSNAAGTLIALDRFWALGLSQERLHVLAGGLGSDVPFFLRAGSAIVWGRGEQVQPVRLGWRGWIVLVCPGFGVPTADVYRAWRTGDQEKNRPLCDADSLGADCDAVQWMERAYNMLEKSARQVCPPLGEVTERCVRLADRPVRVSGSGSTVFTAFDTRNEAEAFAGKVSAQLGLPSHVVQPTEQA